MRNTDTSIIQKYRVNKFPTLIAIGVGAAKHDVYSGPLKYKNLFDFLNIYSETFFKVNEDKTTASDSSKLDKPWILERFPELTPLSSDDICFDNEGVVCVVLLTEHIPDTELKNMVESMQDYTTPKIDRGGIKYKFSWLNCKTQSNFCSTVEANISGFSRVLLINPGKRKRYYVEEEDIIRNDAKFS